MRGDAVSGVHLARQDLELLVARRIGDADLEQEAIELRFGQREGAFVLDRVLRRQHQERLVEAVRLVADGDRALLHRLEQRALHLGGGAVDLVGEDDVGEDRALVDGELQRPRVVDQRADQVGGQQVGRELEALERQMAGLGQRLDDQRLGQAGQALEQHVAAGEQRHDEAVHQLLLADHLPADLAASAWAQGIGAAARSRPGPASLRTVMGCWLLAGLRGPTRGRCDRRRPRRGACRRARRPAR